MEKEFLSSINLLKKNISEYTTATEHKFKLEKLTQSLKIAEEIENRIKELDNALFISIDIIEEKNNDLD